MLSSVTRNPRSRSLPIAIVRCLSTETVSSGATLPPEIPPSKHPTETQQPPPKRSRLHPRPRPPPSQTRQPFPALPQGFGRNQLLSVSNSTRALLESIVDQFDAPIRYAFAYGSGVFEQDGYASGKLKGTNGEPMLDFMFAVTHAGHFHSINMHQHPSHYPMHSRVFGSDYVTRVGEFGPGVWFNAYVPMKDVTIKYGVISVDNLCSDLLNWNSLYLAGRMHKPLRIIKDDARVRLTQQVNLTSAVRSSLLTLPREFSQSELFERIAGISYSGDPRMLLPIENRGKVGNIVRKQEDQFKELYHRLVVGLPGVHWPMHSRTVQQDDSPQARAALVQKLPSELLGRVKTRVGGHYSIDMDEKEYWTKLATNERLSAVLTEEMSKIVRGPATIQSLKGIISAGPSKSLRYSLAKISRYWKGSGKGSQVSS